MASHLYQLLEHAAMPSRPAEPSAYTSGPTTMPRRTITPLTLALHWAFVGVALLPVVWSEPLLAQPVQTDAQRQFQIPAGPLAEALGTFGMQAGVMVASEPALTTGVRTAGVQGTYAVQQALTQLLAGTGLVAVSGAQGGFRLAAGTAHAVTMAPVTVTAMNPTTTEGSESYTTRAVSIGKTSQALKDIAQSVSVVTRQRMDDQKIVSLPDLVNNATGMVGVQGVGAGVAITARGFAVDSLQYDGVPVPRNNYSLGNWQTDSMVFYDRAEILRGAAGLLQGAGSPGGAINLVRKRPTADTRVVVTGTVGSWDQYGLQLDAGTALNKEGTLRGRIVVDEDRRGSYIDYANDRTRSLYAALDYDLTADTTLGVGVSNKLSKSRPMLVGMPRYADGSDLKLSRSTFTGSTWNRARNDQTVGYLDLDHRFNDRWQFKLSGIAMNEKNTTVHQRMAGAANPDGSGLRYGDFGLDFYSQQRGLDASVNGHFDTWGLQHEVVLGANYSVLKTQDKYARAWESGGNIFAIDHDRPWQDIDSIAARGAAFQSSYDVRQKGIYGTWRVKLASPLTAIVGGRLGWYDNVYSQPGSEDSASRASAKFQPYAGLVYALDDRWSLYTSYTEVFEPQSGRTAAGSTLKPVTGTNYEAGIKGELIDSKVNVSLAVFRYNHKNRAVNDYDSGFACDGWYCSRSSGRVRSQGVEAEASGEVLPGLELFAGYTYNTTKFLSDPLEQGEIFSTWTPKHMLRLWANYRLPGTLNKFSVGSGVNVQTDTLSSDREFSMAGFAVWKARVGYQVNNEVSLALNVNNLFDRKYYVPSYNTLSSNNYYGEPRNVMLTVRYQPKM